jgi:hypothetical protein
VSPKRSSQSSCPHMDREERPLRSSSQKRSRPGKLLTTATELHSLRTIGRYTIEKLEALSKPSSHALGHFVLHLSLLLAVERSVKVCDVSNFTLLENRVPRILLASLVFCSKRPKPRKIGFGCCPRCPIVRDRAHSTAFSLNCSPV